MTRIGDWAFRPVFPVYHLPAKEEPIPAVAVPIDHCAKRSIRIRLNGNRAGARAVPPRLLVHLQLCEEEGVFPSPGGSALDDQGDVSAPDCFNPRGKVALQIGADRRGVVLLALPFGELFPVPLDFVRAGPAKVQVADLEFDIGFGAETEPELPRPSVPSPVCERP